VCRNGKKQSSLKGEKKGCAVTAKNKVIIKEKNNRTLRAKKGYAVTTKNKVALRAKKRGVP